MKKILTILLTIFLTVQFSKATTIDTTRVYGVTIDGISKLSTIVTSLSKLCKKPTTRIVFDEWVPATNYVDAVNKIHPVSFIMGEILDSYYMKQYNLQQYTDRTNEYLNLLGDKVDIWEIGNEVNGEWCGKTSDVVAKLNAAYDIVKAKNKKAELTLYYNYNCWETASNEMFRWANANISTKMKNGLDYVFVSYYEDDCNGYQPNWQKMMDSLHVMFPNSKIGIGECGTNKSTKKAAYINRYYSTKVTTKNFVGGCFWWYFRQDCIPYTKALWTTMDNALAKAFTGTGSTDEPLTNVKSDTKFKLGDNYPNPFNPTTRISYSVPREMFVTLKIYDNVGREIATLVNGVKDEGEYSVDFKADGFAAGVYYYKLVAGEQSNVKRMILVK
jgi:hypothetical protein